MITPDRERRMDAAWAAHLPRYQRSMENYARLLPKPDPAADPEADVRS